VKKAQAEADSINILVEQAKENGGMDVLKMRLTQEYIASMRPLAKTGNKVILPYDVTNAHSFVNSGKSVFEGKLI